MGTLDRFISGLWAGSAARRTARAALLGLLVALLPAVAGAQGTVRQTFGDWQLRCETPAGARAEQCAVVQNVAAEDRPNLTLVIVVLRTADQKKPLLRVVAPLGIWLREGLGLRVDQTDYGRARFDRCVTLGCIAQVELEDNVVNQLKSGQTATFVIYQTPEEGIGIPLALEGFAAAYDAIP